jgi:two-component system, sensor histidine kinase YesM
MIMRSLIIIGGDKMRTVRSKLLAIFLIISFLPLLCMSIFSYTVSSKAVKEKAGKEVLNSLEQIGKNVEEKMETVKKYMNTFISSEKFKSTIKNGTFDKKNYQTVIDWKDLNDILGSVLYEDKLVRSLYIYKEEKCIYVFRDDFLDNVIFQKSGAYTKTIDSAGSLYREVYRTKTNDYEILFGRSIRDISKDDNDVLGLVFIFVDEKTLSDIYKVKGISQSGVIFITDGNGNIISHSDKSEINKNIMNESAYREAFGDKNTDYYVTKLNGTDTIVAFHTLKNWNVKVIETIPLKDYTGEVHSILLMTAILGFLLFFSLMLISLLMSSHITRPIKELKVAMKKLRNGDFEVRTAINTKDEFGDISDSFNYMTQKLRELVEKLISEERLRSSTELDMLQYQINPHFLYNTLGSMRFSSLTSGDMKTAEMLQILSRLLKRSLGSAGKLVPVEAELLNIKDYIYIQQIQYNNKINVEFDINEEIFEYMIPNLLLQPLIENAIFHGLDRNMDNPIISISAKKDEGDTVFFIRDNGKGMSANKVKEIYEGKDTLQRGFNNIGIKNVNMRLKLNYGEAYGLNIKSSPGMGTTVEVRLPIFKGGEDEDVKKCFDC